MLQTIPGIQLDYQRTPGTTTFFNIQGALNTTVLVLVDGVRQNDFQQNIIEPGVIPVQQIERIEVVKGAASAAWGPALGGVVNIVTKAPDPDRPLGGVVSGSIGKRTTADSRLEISGTLDRFGYYLAGGNLHSDGLRPNNGVDMDHFHGKVSWRDPAGGTLTASLSAVNSRQGQDEGLFHGWPVHDDLDSRQTGGYLKYSRPLAARLALDLDAYVLYRKKVLKLNDRIDGENIPFSDGRFSESDRGGSARLTWGDRQRNLTAGAEYGHEEARNEYQQFGSEPFHSITDRTWDRWAVFANGAVSRGPVTILPGIRYDHTGIARGYASYTLGATWQATERTLLRAYGARGYGLPFLSSANAGLMRAATVQGGVETEEIPGVWLKGTWFFNRLRNVEDTDSAAPRRQSRQGFELEGRTVPLYGFSLAAGYTFTYAKDVDSGERLQSNSGRTVPPHLLKIGLRYDDADLGLRGTLNGNYLDWNATPDSSARSDEMVWDLHLAWKVRPRAERSPELFLSGHNLTSKIQSTDAGLLDNPSRWFEGGVRCAF